MRVRFLLAVLLVTVPTGSVPLLKPKGDRMTALEIMQAVQAGTVTAEEGAKMLAALNTGKKRKPTIKIGNKRNVVVKLGSQVRYPTTLYANQWKELAEFMPEILKFLEENKHKLAWDASDEAEAA